MRDYFKRTPATIIMAESGQEALEKALHESPDLIYMDVAMPGMNGIDVLELMRKKNKSTRAIIITGFPELLQEQSARLAELDVEAVIEKPFDFSELDELVEKQAV